ncbi:phage filamentation protein Fil family protein [Yersinia enterocolitica]|uniref:phage filamentation protein Fil family protein n=1 Tax=Yersinia enterocolitica TaxID=630 RepID=UPI00398D16D7
MNEPTPSIPSILKSHCEVTHFKPLRGWIETPDGHFFKPDPNKVRFIKGMSKPFVYTKKINKGLFNAFARLFRK